MLWLCLLLSFVSTVSSTICEIRPPTWVMFMGWSRACLRLRLGLSLVVLERAWYGCFSLNSLLSCITRIQRTSHLTCDKSTHLTSLPLVS